MSRLTYWKTNTEWVCAKHLPSLMMPASVGICTFAGCDSVRPRREKFINTQIESNSRSTQRVKPPVTKQSVAQSKPTNTVVRQETNARLCAWFKCDKDNGRPAIARPKSKYCSKDCSNKNARWRHKQRKKSQS